MSSQVPYAPCTHPTCADHSHTPRGQAKRGRCQRTIPVPRVTPPRLLLRHANTCASPTTLDKIRRKPIINTGVTGAEGQPIRRHHRGRRHNSHIRHQALPSHTTGHRTHPVKQTYNPHPVESAS